MSKEEENLLTIFRQIKEDIAKLRETMETQTAVNYEIATQLPIIINQILNDYSTKIDEALKLFKWYAERSTGRKYT